LVAPEEFDAAPIDLRTKRLGGQDLIEALRCGAAGQSDGEAAARGDGLAGTANEFLSGAAAQGFFIGENADDASGHGVDLRDRVGDLTAASCRPPRSAYSVGRRTATKRRAGLTWIYQMEPERGR